MTNVSIRLTNTTCKILTPLTLDQLGVIERECSFEVEGSEYKAAAFKSKTKGQCKWDGRKRLFSTQYQTFPLGLYSRIRHLFDMAGIQVDIEDKRTIMHMNNLFNVGNIQQRPYQDRAVFDSLLSGRGIVKAATGSGKTTIGAMTIGAIGCDAVFIVHTKDLLYQTKEAFERIFDIPIGQIGDGVVDLQSITVATVQSLALVAGFEFGKYKYDEEYDDDQEQGNLIDKKLEIFRWSKGVGTLIFDEVQRVCSRTAYATRFMFENASNVYGYSASPWRDDGSDLMIEAAFGPRIVDITASELIDQGYLVQPYITIKSLSDNVWAGKTYEQVYKSAVVENVFRNMQVVSDAYNEYTKGRPTLVLVSWIKHGQILEQMMRSQGMPASFISGKSGTKVRQQVINDMRQGRAPIVIASTIADVGLDVPRLQSVVEAGAGKSSVTALQRLGRVMRPFEDKDKCYFITYRDTAPYLNTQVDKKVQIWQTEPKFIIVQS